MRWPFHVREYYYAGTHGFVELHTASWNVIRPSGTFMRPRGKHKGLRQFQGTPRGEYNLLEKNTTYLRRTQPTREEYNLLGRIYPCREEYNLLLGKNTSYQARIQLTRQEDSLVGRNATVRKRQNY